MIDFDEMQDALVRGDDEPVQISKADLAATPLFEQMPEGIAAQIFESYFPECAISREADEVVATITDHIYTKYWDHRWHARVFADAMLRAVRRFAAEGEPLVNGDIENEDPPHIWVRWELRMPVTTTGAVLAERITTCFDHVYARADLILQNAESVLVLGKDTDEGLLRLRRIAARLDDMGYYATIIKDEPDRLGESVIQKVMRHALSSKFVVVENTEPSGHLYEIPHVGKAAECVIAFLQQEGKGATWMFEDAFGHQKRWNKIAYQPADLEAVVDEAAAWAEKEVKEFGQFQQRVLPWMKPKGTP